MNPVAAGSWPARLVTAASAPAMKQPSAVRNRADTTSPPSTTPSTNTNVVPGLSLATFFSASIASKPSTKTSVLAPAASRSSGSKFCASSRPS
ncbi:MAG TPA: hypothetical protein VNP03_27845 [Pseudonocardia sp.]|nr:hypothetical protein [Pseudonocardia sp.]